MASFSLEEFVGNGALKEVLPILIEEGWDDVPTVKMLSAEDMHALNFSTKQRDALELRTYLHDRLLMPYADKLEASGKGLTELLNSSPTTLSSEFGMKRGHVARFVDRASACSVTMPPALTPVPASRRRRSSTPSMSQSLDDSPHHPSSPFTYGQPGESAPSTPPPARRSNQEFASSFNSSANDEESLQASNPPTYKGVVAAAPAPPRFCGLVSPPPVPEDVAPLAALDKIYVQKLTPEYRAGVEPWSQGELKVPPPMKASDIWASKPTLVFCIRRPGCVMCRAEAHQIYSRKPIFDAMGVQLVAVLNELIDAEVKSFWPRFWGGMIVVDKSRDFFKALGGGMLPKDDFITGFICNPIARANFRRAKASGIHNNLHGGGLIKGGVLVVRQGRGGVAYQFVERNFGDWAPLEEVLDVCGKLQSKRQNVIKEEILEYSKEFE